ncbi:quinidine resistance protein 3 [Trichomonascus vanleenenianus]|uniref:Qdr3p n=1 Tax=Trichomonascus vanleenenianus TaxID=2268995 RepID=UPI003EC9D175
MTEPNHRTLQSSDIQTDESSWSTPGSTVHPSSPDESHTPLSDSEDHHYEPKLLVARSNEVEDSDQTQHVEKEPTAAENIVTDSGYVPNAERRGWLSFLCLVRERREPREYSGKMKAFIVFLVSASAMIAPMGGSVFLPALNDVAESLHTTTDIVNVSYGMYVLALGIFPLWWSSISELNGRRTVYISSFALFTCFTIGCALSKSIGALIVFRVLSGGAAASVQAVGAGTLSDIYVTTERGRAMGYFYLGPLCGPLLAPIFGGLITERWGWRGTQWFLVIIGAVTFVLVTFALPETLRDERAEVAQLKPPSAQQSQANTGTNSGLNEELYDHATEAADAMLPTLSHTNSRPPVCDVEDPECLHRHRSHGLAAARSVASHLSEVKEHIGPLRYSVKIFFAPFKSFRFLKFAPVPLSIVYSAYCFCCLYFLNLGVQSLYSASPYKFKSIILGLLYIPNSVGYVIASVSNGYVSDRILKRFIKKYGFVAPEARIAENVYFAAALYPAALLIFGWTANAKVFWLAPLVGTFLFGIASMIVFGTTMTYLVDSLPGRGSSAVALNNLLRMVLAAIATFVAAPLERAMGFGWLYTMLAIGSGFAFLSILAIKKWGAKWRANFDLASIY